MLSEVPKGDWSCAFCVADGTGIDNSEAPLTKTEAIRGVEDIEKSSLSWKARKARIA